MLFLKFVNPSYKALEYQSYLTFLLMIVTSSEVNIYQFIIYGLDLTIFLLYIQTSMELETGKVFTIQPYTSIVINFPLPAFKK